MQDQKKVEFVTWIQEPHGGAPGVVLYREALTVGDVATFRLEPAREG
jgi:hypothetical protein